MKHEPTMAEWVRAARGSLTRRQFAPLCGCKESHLCQLENGDIRNPTLETLRAISAASRGRVSFKLEVSGN